MTDQNNDDDDYGAELDAMVQETEKKIDKKKESQTNASQSASTGEKKSFLQSAIESQNSGQPTSGQSATNELDTMMQQLFSGALGGSEPNSSAEMEQMKNLFGSLGAGGAGMPTDIDDKQIDEAQKLIKECMDKIQKTDG